MYCYLGIFKICAVDAFEKWKDVNLREKLRIVSMGCDQSHAHANLTKAYFQVSL